MARTVTTAGRLLELLPLFQADRRVQVLFTVGDGSAFDDGVTDYLREVQARTVSWTQAVDTPFDLAISASANGDLHRLKAPLLLVPHGAGHNRLIRSADGRAEVSGLARRQLVREGRVVPAAIALSHQEQLARLARECPEAVPRAVVTGDPIFDQLVANAERRDRYRRALGVAGDRKLVLLSSTWGEHSLLGANGDLVARLVTELPADEYQVLLVTHPNIWYGHGGLQVRLWLADAREAGLMLLPPRRGWQAALLAADVIVGDHGSVTFYGTALGRPVLLASSGHEAEELDPGSPTAALCRVLPRLERRRGLERQIETVMAGHRTYQEVTSRTLGMPGRAKGLLRGLAYRLMDLSEHDSAPLSMPLAEPCAERDEVLAFLVEADVQDTSVTLRRFPAVPGHEPDDRVRDVHLIVAAHVLDRRLLESAAIIIRDDAMPGWAAETLRRYPGCHLAAEITDARSVHLTLRDGRRLLASVRGRPPDPWCLPSAVHGRLTNGREPEDITIQVGGQEFRISVTPPPVLFEA
ncbi:CDP-glycerol glycerophosphotransferase family protein [Nonomuraea solani]|uniref:CDP-glycerol glycerophosphotransferase family protein n=1 Tax=Nonomuraea solani TaxID=1144553 RepID=UPI000CDEDEA5|nr:CDP-glycerol glycerophosphotransferase family protein [Nonomuraea solani]